MIAADEDALTCDFMETYRIMDFRTLPVSKAAILAVGLRADSRIKMILNGDKVDEKTILLAGITDALNTLVWFQSEDGVKKINRPASIIGAIFNSRKEDESFGFESADAFETERKRILGGL